MTPTNSEQEFSPVTIMTKQPTVNVGQIERWLSGVGGFLLTAYGFSRTSLKGMMLALGGSYLLYRGMGGHCPAYAAANMNTATAPAQGEVKLKTAVTVNKPVSEVYQYWRNLENLPSIMKHLTAVTIKDDKHSHWCVKAGPGMMLEWDAEIIAEQENRLLAWRSLPGASVKNMGLIQFLEAPGNRGTEVQVNISYDVPAGALGDIFAPLLNKVASQQVKDDLRHFKQMMEAGETVSVEGQPSGRSSHSPTPTLSQSRPAAERDKKRFGSRQNRDLVEEMGRDSFPASDPPASW